MAIKPRLTIFRVVRYYFPRASKETIEFILWEKTGWPGFWHGDPLTCLAKQLKAYKRSQEIGRHVCFCCGRIRFKGQMDSMGMCAKGQAVMEKIKAESDSN